MRKYIHYILLTGILSFGLFSCEDYLDKTEESIISEEEAFKNFTNFQGYTEELYQCIVNFSNNYWTNSWNWGEDEITTTDGDYHFIHKIDNGNFWGWQSEFDGWGSGWMNQSDFSTTAGRFNKDVWNAAWYGIRKVNIGLANLELMTDATDEERDLIEGQLLFFRAWLHFSLIQYFGGLPYIDYVLPSDEPLRLPRLSYAECADKAAVDFRRAADLLPIDWDETQPGKNTLGKNRLRINKIEALGYLGKNYLWAGSPLMNYESTGNKTYNTEYCKKAAQAFGELLELTESGTTPFGLLNFEDYSQNFYTTGQNWAMPGMKDDVREAIMQGPISSANDCNWGTSKQYMPKIVGDGGGIKFLPTANYVDKNYGMSNGLPIPDITKPDAESGYDPQYPWRNRDPRFYHDIIYDGTKVVQGSTTDEVNRYAHLYTGGSYRGTSGSSRTGYVLQKIAPSTCNKYDNGYSWGNSLHIYVPYMRLADVYLMYAEAAAEGYGSSAGADPTYGKTALDAINVIRDRAGVGHVAGKFSGSLDGFIEEVRRERAVELAYEGHRFNDLRRWLLLTESEYCKKTSIEFDRVGEFNADDPTQNMVANLREVTILERKLSSKHYWLPLKRADVNMYPEFPQNPGW